MGMISFPQSGSGGSIVAYEVQVRKLQRQPAAVVRFKCSAGQAPQYLGPAYGEIGGYLHEAGVQHEDTGVYARFLQLGPEMEVEAGFTIPEAIAPGAASSPASYPRAKRR
jgi:hypothetical protein